MPQCAVATCRNSHRKTKGRRVRYHRFPAEESVRERWVAVCGRSTIFNTTTARVCSLHFSAPSYERDVEHELLGLPPRSRLRRGAVPDLFVPIEVPSLIKKFNSSPPAPRNYTRHAVPHLNGGVMKNFMLKGGKLAKQQQGQGLGNNNRRRGGAARVMLSGMTPPAPPSPLQQEANHYEVLLALGLVPRNNNSWVDVADGQALSSAGGVLHRMPVMEGAAAAPKNVKARSRAASLDAAPTQNQNGAGVTRDSEEAVSEGEGVARAAAALVSVKVDVDEKPLVFRGDGTTAAVKAEPAEHATSSGGPSDDEDDAQAPRQSGVKRRGEVAVNAGETLLKRARRDLEDSGPGDEEDERERMVRNFVDSASSEGPDEAARCAESLRNELNMLRALAEAKEREWNQVIRLRALKEEMLLRLERRRAVLSLNEPRRGVTGSRQRPILPKPLVNGAPNSIIGEGRQGPIVDVRSIIADHRSRHPEAVPRRGRRLKPGAPGATSPAQAELSELGSLLSEALHRPATDNSRPSSADSSRSGVPQAEPSISFKDVLVKFAKMSQSDQHQQQQQQQQTPPRLPYPEVTLHPVAPAPALGPASSLLQGILSKPGSAATPRATNFSPTLARLLTAPERPTPNSGTTASSSPGVSINDLLGPTKGRTEITITPVASQVTKPRGKASDVVMLDTEAGDDDDEDGEEREESGDRLVIDEAESEVPSGRKHTQGSRRTAPVQQRKPLPHPAEEGEEEDDDEEEEVPECQGCHRNQAQFVCAGCGNQWYCSRECQVAAWDDHSEVCSG